jgi:hypothetical protein
MRLRATDSEGFAALLPRGETNMRELFLGMIPLAIGFYFLFHHEQFMTMVGWLARLVR